MTETGRVLGFQGQYLKGLAHDLKPIVQVGKDGLSEAVVAQTKAALLDHELIKVRLTRPEDKKTLARELAEACDAHYCALIGHTVILYRPHPKKRVIVLPTRTEANEAERG